MIGKPGVSPPPATPLPPYWTLVNVMTSPAEALKQVYSRYVGALQGASDFLRDDLPSASPGVSKWVQEVGRRACRNYARQRGSIPFLTSDPSWDGICSGYWDAINEGPTSEGSYEPPFSGGQCIGVAYFLRENVTRWDTNGNFLSQQTLDSTPALGPVSFLALPDIDQGPNGSLQTGRARFVFAGGVTIDSGAAKVVYRPTGITTQILTRQILRADGQADTCGDPPPQYRPPTFPTLPPLPPPTNPAPGLGDNWEVNILPDGKVAICIGGECSTGTPPSGGSGPDSGGGPGEPDGEPQENDPNDPDDPNEITGCVEEGSILTGLKIEITETPINSSGSNGVNYRVAWIYMGPDSDKLDLVSDGRTLENGQFIIPDSRDCTCYKVRVNLGWRLRVQAFSRAKEE